MSDFLHYIFPGMPETKEHKLSREILAQLKGGEGSGNFGHAGRPGEVGGSSNGENSLSVKNEIQNKVDNGEYVKNINKYISPREDHVYRFVTKEDYDKALRTGELSPGRAADNGGTVNFSKEPIPVYGGSAFLEAGLLVEVPENKFGDTRIYHGSNDLYIASYSNVPLSSVSRAWAYQFGDPKGIQIVDVSNIVKKLGKS